MRSLLLLPLLGPLLAILLVAALNPRPQVALRLLIWSTPTLPLGAWMALAASGGAALSGGAAALALSRPGRRRQIGSDTRRPMAEPFDAAWMGADAAPAPSRSAAETRPPRSDPAAASGRANAAQQEAASAGPVRAPGEPPPTVVVPFRVIQRPAHPSSRAGSAAATAASAAPATASAAGATGGDWESGPEEDW